MSRSLLKILLLADSRSVHTERFINELQRQGCRVLLASLEHGHLEHISLSTSKQARTHNYVYAVPKVRTLIDDFQPDIIDAHFASGYGFLISLLGDNYHTPRVLHVLGSDILIAPHKSWLHRFKVVRALRKADCVVADSEYLSQSAGALTEIRKQAVIPWGIEETCLSYHKQDYSLQKPLKIIVPRAHEPVYNNVSIVKALVPLLQEKKVILSFPSTGSLFGAFRSETENLAGDAVQFYTPLPRDEFMRYMASHDVYISASRSDSSPVSLIEAMALGLIPVVADTPGIKEWVGPNNGYLFPADDENRLYEIVSRLIGDNNPHIAIRKQNLEQVKQSGIFEENMKCQIELMKTLVEANTE